MVFFSASDAFSNHIVSFQFPRCAIRVRRTICSFLCSFSLPDGYFIRCRFPEHWFQAIVRLYTHFVFWFIVHATLFCSCELAYQDLQMLCFFTNRTSPPVCRTRLLYTPCLSHFNYGKMEITAVSYVHACQIQPSCFSRLEYIRTHRSSFFHVISPMKLMRERKDVRNSMLWERTALRRTRVARFTGWYHCHIAYCMILLVRCLFCNYGRGCAQPSRPSCSSVFISPSSIFSV